MKKPALTIRELSIYKMPGFPQGMKPLKNLAQHINVIAGPNASGKSSTARMIQDVIWKQNMDSIHVNSRLSIQDKLWNINIDNGHYNSQSNGLDEPLPAMPAVDEAQRYSLALHELIKENDRNLAAEILRETIGGYDLQKAKQELEYKNSTPNRGINQYKNFEAKRRNVEEIERKQTALQNEERKLTKLYEEYESAKKADQYKQIYLLLVDYLQAKREYDYLKNEQTSYPAQMSLLNGNEDTVLSKLEKDLETNNQEINNISRTIENKKVELSALQIPEKGLNNTTLEELNENIIQLENLERHLERRRIDIEKLKQSTKVALQQLFTSLKQEDLAFLDLDKIHDLDSFFKKAHQLLYKKQTLENEIQRLNKTKQSLPYSEENIHHGIRILLNWFEKEGKVEDTSKSSLWILLILGVITVPVTYFFDWLGFVSVVLMLLYILFKKQHAPTDALRQTRENDFKRTGLSTPTKWEEEEVSKKIEELYQQLSTAKQQQEIQRRLKELKDHLEQIQPDFKAIETERQQWLDRLSDIPELKTENIESYSGLYWLLKNLHLWQQHHNELQAEKKSYEEEQNAYTKTLTRINNLFDELGIPTISDTVSAKVTLKSLVKKVNNRTTILSTIQNLEQQRQVFKDLTSKSKEEILSIYKRLNLQIDEKNKLINLISKKEDFDLFEKELEQTRRRFAEREHQLQDHSLYAEIKDELPVWSIDKAIERQKTYEQESAKAESLYTEIAQTEAHISKERTGKALEVALTEREAALDELEEYYGDNIASITGDIIINGLKRKTQEHSHSKVFNRANELFNKITHGQYELILDDDRGGSFRAKDTVLNQGLPLEHLSSGTRIQLLIAVRLAFIESQETGIKLPIIADEVLANSDDLRAQQIIEALIEISKEGRQVFYFTAQTDELKKWQEYLLKHTSIEGKTFILKGPNSITKNYQFEAPTDLPSLSFNDILAPGNYSNREYHKLLIPPKYNLLNNTPEQLHLSYLIEDNALLYACLQRGIKHYGQLKSFIKYQGLIEGLDDTQLQTIDEKVEILAAYQELYQRGRSKPIDRSVLQSSGAVSDTFIDTVTAKLKEVDYHPARLVQALREREVSGFLNTKINELEAYLLDHNYLNEEEPLTAEEIDIPLRARLSQMRLSEMEADRFLQKTLK